MTEKPMIFEIFTDVKSENDALYKIYNIEVSQETVLKRVIKGIVGEKVVNAVKKIVK